MTPRVKTELGKRAGVASGALGALCVLAELCFLFPDVLVTPDAWMNPVLNALLEAK